MAIYLIMLIQNINIFWVNLVQLGLVALRLELAGCGQTDMLCKKLEYPENRNFHQNIKFIYIFMMAIILLYHFKCEKLKAARSPRAVTRRSLFYPLTNIVILHCSSLAFLIHLQINRKQITY